MFNTFSDKWRKRLLILIVVVIAIEVCLELTVLSFNGGSPRRESGVLMISEVPETDAVFVETSMNALQEIGWWQEQIAPQLISLKYRFDCFRVQQYWTQLDFLKVARITLPAESVNYATIEFRKEDTELHYLLEDYGISRLEPHTGINLGEVSVASTEAVQQAERNGGEAVRALIDIGLLTSSTKLNCS